MYRKWFNEGEEFKDTHGIHGAESDEGGCYKNEVTIPESWGRLLLFMGNRDICLHIKWRNEKWSLNAVTIIFL